MKSNVDLTENRDFRKNNQVMNHKISSIIKRDFPWNLNEFDGFIEDDLIPLGNKKERSMKKEFAQLESGYLCERCGKDLLMSPWKATEFTICVDCDQLLEEEMRIKNDFVLSF